MRTKDDGLRGPVAICLSLRRDGENIELTMDDVVLHGDQDQDPHWHHDRFITFANITAKQIDGEMTEDDYARFGRFIFGSLSALAKFRLAKDSKG